MPIYSMKGRYIKHHCFSPLFSGTLGTCDSRQPPRIYSEAFNRHWLTADCFHNLRSCYTYFRRFSSKSPAEYEQAENAGLWKLRIVFFFFWGGVSLGNFHKYRNIFGKEMKKLSLTLMCGLSNPKKSQFSIHQNPCEQWIFTHGNEVSVR